MFNVINLYTVYTTKGYRPMKKPLRGTRKKMTGFQCPEPLRQKLEDLAMRDDRTLSQMVVRCCEAGIDVVEAKMGTSA